MEKYFKLVFIVLFLFLSHVFSQQSDYEPDASNKGSIKILTEPSGVTCYVDGIAYGETPVIISDLTFGKHILRFEKTGYFSKEELITISSRETQDINVTLDGVSYLTVNVIPKNAKILINNKEVGKGSITKARVKSGDVLIHVKAPGYKDFKQTVHLEPTKHKAVTGNLVSLYGTLIVNSEPKKATVYLNEKKLGITPFKSPKVGPGEYFLKVSLKDYKEIIEDITIIRNKTTKKEFDLEPLKGVLEVKKKKSERFQWIRRISFGSLAAGFFAAGIYYNNEVKINGDKYTDSKASNSSTHDKNWDKVEENRKARNIMYSVSGGCAVLCAISIPF
jgi:hypothetical protein